MVQNSNNTPRYTAKSPPHAPHPSGLSLPHTPRLPATCVGFWILSAAGHIHILSSLPHRYTSSTKGGKLYLLFCTLLFCNDVPQDLSMLCTKPLFTLPTSRPRCDRPSFTATASGYRHLSRSIFCYYKTVTGE